MTISALVRGLQILRPFAGDGDITCQGEWIRVRVRALGQAQVPLAAVVRLRVLGWKTRWDDAYEDEGWEWSLD